MPLSPGKAIRSLGSSSPQILLDDPAAAVNRRRLTGATIPIAALEQSNLVSRALHVIGRDQAVNCGADDSDVLQGFCRRIQGIIQSRLPARNGP